MNPRGGKGGRRKRKKHRTLETTAAAVGDRGAVGRRRAESVSSSSSRTTGRAKGGAEKPPYSCRVDSRRGVLIVRINVKKWRIPPEKFNFNPRPDDFHFDTFGSSKELLLRFKYPDGIKVRASEESAATLEYGMLVAELPIVEWGSHKQNSLSSGIDQSVTSNASNTKKRKRRKKSKRGSDVKRLEKVKQQHQHRPDGTENHKGERSIAMGILEKVENKRLAKLDQKEKRAHEIQIFIKTQKARVKRKKKNIRQLLQGIQQKIEATGDVSAATDVMKARLQETNSKMMKKKTKSVRGRESSADPSSNMRTSRKRAKKAVRFRHD